MRALLVSVLLGCAGASAAMAAQGRPPEPPPQDQRFMLCTGGGQASPQQRINACSQAISSNRYAGQALSALYLARVALNQEGNNLDAAMADANEVMRLAPEEPVAYFARGTIYEQRNDPMRAYEDFTKAIMLAPDYADAYAERGFLLLGMNMPDADKAFSDFSNAVKNDGMSVAGHVGRGAIYLMRNQNAQARADFDAAARIDPMDPQALYGRGIAERRAGDQRRGNADIGAANRLYGDAGALFKSLGVNE
jgi:tetratricopeptide (TPR) repeat protein